MSPLRTTPPINPQAVQELGDALAQLRLRLLDLTGRNRLLNYKHPAGKSLQFIEGHPTALYGKLSETTITIKALPEPSRVDWTMKNGRWTRPEPREWAISNGISTSYDLSDLGSESDTSLRALMYADDLAKHCRKIEREALLAIEETGANMLYLVLGFLDFPDQRDSDRNFSAPLLCIPVVLSKKPTGGSQIFSIRYTGDDVTENLSLREKLRQDHGLVLPELDEEEINVKAYFSALEHVIKTRLGFTLRRRVSLCLLSFTNMLLVRDLDPANWAQASGGNGLLDHAIVNKVFAGDDAISNNASITSPEYAIEEEPARSIPLVFDADSSQHSALVDVLLNKRNLVIEGPPGTGKSQTITNLIAASLADKKRVLFVSEKLAALEVVRNRLAMAGLKDFLLELHSTRASKKKVLEQIENRIGCTIVSPRELPQRLQELEHARTDLKSYADLLNSARSNQFGLTLHEVMWRAERHRQLLSKGEGALTQTTIHDATEITALELERRMQSLENLGEQYSTIGQYKPDHPFWAFSPAPMVPGDELRLERTLSQCRELASKLISDAEALGTILGVSTKLTKDKGISVREVLSALVNDLDEKRPLHLTESLLEPDGSGQVVRRELEKLRVTLQHFRKLDGDVQAGLMDEAHASQARLLQLTQLKALGDDLGVDFGSVEEIENLSNALRSQSDRLSFGIETIRVFCTENKIPFEPTVDALQKITTLANAIGDVPTEHLHVQSKRLVDPKCIFALEGLASLQGKWSNLERELSASLYLDDVPENSVIQEAIETLTHGDAWYRILQPGWRSAISLHKRVQRHKTRMQSEDRLADLHQIVNLRSLKNKWKADPAWEEFLSRPAPDGTFSLHSFFAVAKWNNNVIGAMDEVGIQLFVPDEVSQTSARKLRRDYAELQKHIIVSSTALQFIRKLLPGTAGQAGIPDVLQRVNDLVVILNRHIAVFGSDTPPGATLKHAIAAHESALQRKKLRDVVENNQILKDSLKDQFLGVNTDVERMLACLAVAEQILRLPIPTEFRRKLLAGDVLVMGRQILDILDRVLVDLEGIEGFSSVMQSFGDFDLQLWVGASPSDGLLAFALRLDDRAALAISNLDNVISWSRYISRKQEVKDLGLVRFVELLESGHVHPMELRAAYGYSTFSSIIRDSFRHTPELGKFSGLKHSKIRNEFKRLDREIIQLRGKEIAAQSIRSAVPPVGTNGTRVDDKTDLVLLKHLLPQQRPRMPVRKMLKRAGRAIQALKPCFMMGPQAVAQYLTPGAVTFDLVIMDEASQLKPEEAIGAIARGSQLVVVGDPKQLPPTSFFTRMSQVGEEDDQFTTTDAESILDLCLGQFHPTRQLRWHYRSQHHSLIAFSNHYFYRNLVVFPSPYGQSSTLGVRATYLADAVYEDQTNYKEALRVVDAVVAHIESRPSDSLGVVTLNLKQRDLIAELLDERLQNMSGAALFRERWASESQPLFIKNLENVQGDERDAIIISTTFGKPVGADAVRQNFGPISRHGGWRRLNVLFTRAKKSIALFTSMRPEDIVIDGNTPDGTKALRNYLEYARTGCFADTEELGAAPESDFEVSIINLLKSHGYEVTPQLGVAGYRIDIAVKHPKFPAAYLAAIECDGASYHSAVSVRDRDRIRQEILESMGWRDRIWRIWSTDWFRTPRQESDKLLGFLRELAETWTPTHSSNQSWVEVKRSGEASGVTEKELDAIQSSLPTFEDELAVRVGDTIRYADVTKLNDVMTVQITQDKTDIGAGMVHRGTPLAHTLLGSVVSDEVTMHLPGASARTFRIIEVKRPNA